MHLIHVRCQLSEERHPNANCTTFATTCGWRGTSRGLRSPSAHRPPREAPQERAPRSPRPPRRDGPASAKPWLEDLLQAMTPAYSFPYHSPRLSTATPTTTSSPSHRLYARPSICPLPMSDRRPSLMSRKRTRAQPMRSRGKPMPKLFGSIIAQQSLIRLMLPTHLKQSSAGIRGQN